MTMKKMFLTLLSIGLIITSCDNDDEPKNKNLVLNFFEKLSKSKAFQEFT